MALPTPHLEKLNAALANKKLPAADRPRIRRAKRRYGRWIEQMAWVSGDPAQAIASMVALLNDYKRYVDLEVIFDSSKDFLYRQKGQLKLDNSIVEEFLPWLMTPRIMPELADGVRVGPNRCFSSVYFDSRLDTETPGGGMRVRAKDQDFAISRRLYIKASHTPDFAAAAEHETYIAYVTAEIKTNVDKTMFQEACATAHDVKTAVAGSKYMLLCEWLDMTPLSTAATDIDEVLILRGAKRLSSSIRRHFSSSRGRRSHRETYTAHLDRHPFRVDVFQRFVNHIRGLLNEEPLAEDDVLAQGFF